MIAQYPHTLFIGVGRELCNYQDYFQRNGGGETAFYETTDQLLAEDLLGTISRAEILVKGARQFQFERIVQHLAKQVHETTLEIDLEALESNLKSYKALLPAETRIIVMAKAQGYGCLLYTSSPTPRTPPPPAAKAHETSSAASSTLLTL